MLLNNLADLPPLINATQGFQQQRDKEGVNRSKESPEKWKAGKKKSSKKFDELITKKKKHTCFLKATDFLNLKEMTRFSQLSGR